MISANFLRTDQANCSSSEGDASCRAGEKFSPAPFHFDKTLNVLTTVVTATSAHQGPPDNYTYGHSLFDCVMLILLIGLFTPLSSSPALNLVGCRRIPWQCCRGAW